MQRFSPKIFLRIGISYFFSLNILYAAQSSFNLTPLTPTSANLPLSGGVVNVIYNVTNQSQITRTITMRPIAGVSQITNGSGNCPNPFTLLPHQSCQLNLQITAEVSGGPVLCKTKSPNNNTPDPFLCSQPSQADILSIYSNTCKLDKFSFKVSRYPVQTDPNATYYAAIISQANVQPGMHPSITVADNFPESTYYSIDTYDIQGNFYSRIINNQIPAIYPNINPNLVGNLVLATPRFFTIDTRTSNYFTLPPASLYPEVVVVIRNYQTINGQDYAPEPLILDGGLTCGGSGLPESSDTNSTVPDPLPLPIDNVSTDYLNDINFYNIGTTPYGDGLTGYLGTSLVSDLVGVIQIPQLPSFFNTTNINSSSIYPLVDVEYISFASYGANLAVNNVLSGNGTNLINQSAYYVVIPQAFLVDPKYRALYEHGCANLNILVLQPIGTLNNYPPYLILREKAPLDAFSGNFNLVPVFDNGQFNNMTLIDKQQYAAKNYIAPYSPLGHQCNDPQFSNSGCGYPEVMQALTDCGF